MLNEIRVVPEHDVSTILRNHERAQADIQKEHWA